MANAFQVTCTTKDGPDFDRRIDRIGGSDGKGGVWTLSLDDAIAGIQRQEWTFYTIVNNVRATVFVRQHQVTRRPFLTTSPDGLQPNNLLKLPDCPR